ncbi:MAG: hypothetical protein U5S82_18895 [Gammaproteobacteria bacterium]|nr:hypothetical protein [Gammaproteobacteria bacterium]
MPIAPSQAGSPAAEEGAGEVATDVVIEATDALIEDIRVAIDGLLDAVAQGDKAARSRFAGRTLAGLDALDQRLRGQAGVTLGGEYGSWRVALASPGLEPAAVRDVLEDQPALASQLDALRRNWVGRLAFAAGKDRRLVLRYHPPTKSFVASERRLDEDRGNDRLVPEGERRAKHLAQRGRQLAAAWAAAEPLVLAVSGPAAQALDLDLDLDTDRLEVDYLDTGWVVPIGEQTHAALLEEVRLQLQYILNVKVEGPPLLKALQANLFFDEEFGFMAWGGRWPAFAGKMFVFRHDPARERWLVRVEPVPFGPT